MIEKIMTFKFVGYKVGKTQRCARIVWGGAG